MRRGAVRGNPVREVLAAWILASVAGCSSGPDGAPLTETEEAALRSQSAEVEAEIAKAIADRAFPGASIAIGTAGRVLYLRGFGRLDYSAGAPAVTPDTIYDLASLTKVIGTTSAAMVLVQEGRIALDDPVSKWIPEARGSAVADATIRDLLTHRAGLPAWIALYKERPAGRGADWFIERILREPLAAPRGERTIYSDLGMILVGEILSRAAGEGLDAFVDRRVFRPLGMEMTLYRPPARLLDRIAPTEEDASWRGKVVHGEVHDENAASMGGVAGHAGLFSTARDLARFASAILSARLGERGPFPVDAKTVLAFTAPEGASGESSSPGADRAIGWGLASPGGSSGSLFSAASFGHTGFTGTSIWIDPEARLFVVLLTNRVHPTRENQKIGGVRRRVHDAAVRDWHDRIARALRTAR
ncbi:MAG: beta-lactamase family protein [Planctomycetes bacterium]|nr:beta-lactamase family protein [Planctomycetota bacterium]